MERAECYYRRGGGERGEIVVARDARVLRMIDAGVWGYENFKLFGGKSIFLRKFLLGEVGEICNFWGLNAIRELSFGVCGFSSQEIENWEDYVLVDGDFWIFLIDDLLRRNFLVYFNGDDLKFLERKFEGGKPLDNFKIMIDYLKICDDSKIGQIHRVIVYYGWLMKWIG